MTTVDEVQRLVSRRFGIRRHDMLGKGKWKRIARPRQLAMYLTRALTDLSYPEIGDAFKRDHTTALHAVQMVEDLIGRDPVVGAVVDEMAEALEAP